MLRLFLLSTIAVAMASCQAFNTESDSKTKSDTNPQPVQESDSTKAEISAVDKQVYAHLYAIQAVQGSEQNLLPEVFDPAEFAEALLAVQEGLSSLASDDLSSVLKAAATEEVLRASTDLILAAADTNDDRMLSYGEFMEFRIGQWDFTPELDQNIQIWRQVAYPVVAGEDGFIDSDELLALLVMQRGYVAELRSDQDLFRNLVQATREQFVYNFDENKDGQLSPEELQAVQDAVRAERDRYHARVDDHCAVNSNSDEPVCRIESAFNDWCDNAEEGSLTETICKLINPSSADESSD